MSWPSWLPPGRPPSTAQVMLAFVGLAVVLFLLLGSWVQYRTGLIKEVARNSHLEAAEQELGAAIERARTAIRQEADQLAAWNETRQQLREPSFYLYWRNSRALSGQRLPSYLEALEIYGADGLALQAADQPSALPRRVPESRVYLAETSQGPRFFLFRPIPSERLRASQLLGFLGVRADFREAMLQQTRFRYLDPKTLHLSSFPEKALSPEAIADHLRFKLLPRTDTRPLERVIRRSFVQYTLLALALGGLFYLLVHYLVARPLRKLARHIDNLRAGTDQPALLLAEASLPLAETEKLRRSINAYEHNLGHLHQRLDQKNEELWDLAHRDPLTELPNRRLFQERLDQALQRHGGEDPTVAVLFLDLDGFKNVNDSLGHPLGDSLLKAVADRLSGAMPADATLARVGGDEFLILLNGLTGWAEAATVAQEIVASFWEPFGVEGYELYLGASIGISLFPLHGRDATTLVKNADAAVFQAKEAGRNQYQFYTADLTVSASERVHLERELRRALAGDELRVFFQPQIEMGTGRLVGAEALVRWQHPERGLLLPGQFLALAEATGLIGPIGQWVMEAACLQVAAWGEEELVLPRVAVNICGSQIQRGDLARHIREVVLRTGLPPRSLELEVTESSFMQDLQGASDTLEGLRSLGVRIAIDDFGTGSSSLAYLKRLPIDRLKVDKSFVADIPHDPNDAAIVRAVIVLGQSLELEVLAEGVETHDQAAFLESEGCRLAQGFLYGDPMPAESLQELLAPA